jgi:hypothetical protein
MARAKRNRTSKTHALVAKGYSFGSPEFAKPMLRTARFSDYILAMQEASFHFGIDAPAEKYPKVEELWAYFRDCRQPKAKGGGAHPQKKRPLTP